MRQRDAKGQVAIVTGASSGVGWQSAVRLAEHGFRLCVTARRKDALEQLQEQLVQRGAECLVVPGDVSVQEDVENVVDECIARYGRVDVLVNNAGVQAYGYFDQLPWDQVTRIFDVTCFGYFRFARAVLPHFKRQGSGHIINVLSMLSKGAAPLLSVYTAAKHALLGWAECLRLELHGTGIAVSGVLIPSVSTPMFDHAPTMLDHAPQPVPPTYDTDVAARSVVQCALKPGRNRVPVFLQGSLVLLANRWLPRIGSELMSRFGVRWQMRDESIRRREGNLFRAVPEGVGPYGSVPPTPKWVRFGLAAGVVSAIGGIIAGAGIGVRTLARRT